MRRTRLLVSAIALGLLASIGTASLAGAQATATTVTLAPLNNSGISGSATLTDLGGGRTRVVVNVTGSPAGANHPAHIHDGSCPTPGAVRYPLQNIQNGTSTTEVNASLADLMRGTFAVNLHRSAQEASVYVACGNVQQAAAAAPAAPATLPRTGDLGSIAPLAVAAGLGLVGLGFALRRRTAR